MTYHPFPSRCVDYYCCICNIRKHADSNNPALINNMYKIWGLGERDFCLFVFSRSSASILLPEVQNVSFKDRTSHSEKRNLWGTSSHSSKLKSVLLTSPKPGTLAPKVLFWLESSQRFLGASPYKVSYFFLSLKNNVRSTVAWWLNSLMYPG